MAALTAFLLALFFSFVGSIPPGTLNLLVIQLGLNQKLNTAWRFSIAAALVEYPYAWLAVKFETLITASPWIIHNIHLLTAVVMTVLGILNLLPAKAPSVISQKFNESGFRRGIVLSILNPLAIPYWLGITAYLRSQGWITLSSPIALHSYLLGVSIGALLLLILLAFLARKIVSEFVNNIWLKRIPGIMLLALGLYAFIVYFIEV